MTLKMSEEFDLDIIKEFVDFVKASAKYQDKLAEPDLHHKYKFTCLAKAYDATSGTAEEKYYGLDSILYLDQTSEEMNKEPTLSCTDAEEIMVKLIKPASQMMEEVAKDSKNQNGEFDEKVAAETLEELRKLQARFTQGYGIVKIRAYRE